MKSIRILSLIFCVTFSMNSKAQSKDKNILKVSYTVGALSDFMAGMLKQQIQDPEQRSNFFKMMEDYKVHSSYYQNIKTKESVFVLDSISEVKGVSTTGHTYYVYKNKDGDIDGKEIFMGKDIDFKGNADKIEWTITDEQKEINGYQCKKAYLKDRPKVYVWFTPEISVNGGPYIFFGLQGLVLESNSPFESINVATVSYSSKEEFHNKITEVKEKINPKKAISFEEMFTKKENFQRMIEKGK